MNFQLFSDTEAQKGGKTDSLVQSVGSKHQGISSYCNGNFKYVCFIPFNHLSVCLSVYMCVCVYII